MNCDCIKRIEEKFVTQVAEWKEKKILRASVQSLWKMEPKFMRVTSSHVTVSLEGRKAEVVIDLSHIYCPFCGKKIDIETENDNG